MAVETTKPRSDAGLQGGRACAGSRQTAMPACLHPLDPMLVAANPDRSLIVKRCCLTGCVQSATLPTPCQTSESASAAGCTARGAQFVLQVQQPVRLPMYVQALHDDGRVAVVFDAAKACRFPNPCPAAMRQTALEVASWSEPGHVTWAPAPL